MGEGSFSYQGVSTRGVRHAPEIVGPAPLQKRVGDLCCINFGGLCQYNSTERQKRSQILAPALVIVSGNSLVFSRKIITSTGFYRYCAPGASAPVVVKNQSPILSADIVLTKDPRPLYYKTPPCAFRAHANRVVLCERTCFCLLSTF